MPSWVGDAVMATPTLRALRTIYPQAHITALTKETVRPIIDACPWIDRIVTLRKGKPGKNPLRSGMLFMARRLAAAKFDTAVLLPNSFRSALLVKMIGVDRVIGYERDGRGFLLTDRLLPRRGRDGFIPVPTLDYYLGIARYLGAVDPSMQMQLFTRTEDDLRADRLLIGVGFDPLHSRRKLIVMNPGASYGAAKMWHPERFAALADRCTRELDSMVAITGAPSERPILDAVLAAAGEQIIDLPAHGMDLALLKSVVRRATLMVTNDTGPRHIAAALGVPVVTLFGPTDQAWTQIDFEYERQISVDVYCRPCQQKICPLKNTPDDHQCMKKIDPPMVFEQVTQLLARVGAPS